MPEATSKTATQWWPLPSSRLPFPHLPFSHLTTTALSAGSSLLGWTLGHRSHNDDDSTKQPKPAPSQQVPDSFKDQAEHDMAVLNSDSVEEMQLQDDLPRPTGGRASPSSVHPMTLRSRGPVKPKVVKRGQPTKTLKPTRHEHLKNTVARSKSLRKRRTKDLQKLQRSGPKQDTRELLAKLKNYAGEFHRHLVSPNLPRDLHGICKDELKELEKVFDLTEQVMNEARPGNEKVESTTSPNEQSIAQLQPMHSPLPMRARPSQSQPFLDAFMDEVRPPAQLEPEHVFRDHMEIMVQKQMASPLAPKIQKGEVAMSEYKVTEHDLDLGLHWTLESCKTIRENCEEELAEEVNLVAYHVTILNRKLIILETFAQRMEGHTPVQSRITAEITAINDLLVKANSVTHSRDLALAQRALASMDERNLRERDRAKRKNLNGVAEPETVFLSDDDEEAEMLATTESKLEAREPVWLASSKPDDRIIKEKVQPRYLKTDQGVLLDLLSDEDKKLESDSKQEMEEMDVMDYELVETLP